MRTRPPTNLPLFEEARDLQLELVIIDKNDAPDPRDARDLEASCHAMSDAELNRLTHTAWCGGGTGGLGH